MRSDGPRPSSGAKLYNIEPHALHNALIMLEHAGILERAGETVYASRAARWLDGLGLIAV